MGEQVAAGLKKKMMYAKVSLRSPSHTDRLNIAGTECVPPITEGRTVEINAGFTSGQRVQKVLSFLMTDKDSQYVP